MKKYLLFTFSFLCFVCFASAQLENPVKWSFTAKKITANVYEVQMTASISGKYHIYSLNGGDGPLSTTFTFTKNPLITVDGNLKEVGKVIKKYEEVFKSDVRYFEKSVTFVQTVKLKNKVKTKVAGKVEFLACDDHECLPPASVDFSVAVGG